ALGLPWRFALNLRNLRPPRPDETQAARIDTTAPVLALQGLHYAGDQPFCHESRIINPAAAPAALAQDFRTIAPGQWLLREIPWTSAEHRIRAINAPATIARALALPTGEACLEVTRRTEIAGQWVTLVTQTYPGSRHQLVSRFTPDER
ncbi:MAG: UTRA domain-containing protein, partial [Paracoccaceae bacterium]